ncbi:MAG: flagellar basal body-associated protein FliL [Thioalkalivibrionaceae bacterium]
MAQAPKKTDPKSKAKPGANTEEVVLEAEGKSGLVKWIIIGLVAFVLVGGAAAAAVYFLLLQSDPDQEAEAADFSGAPWTYRTLDPITVNLDAPGRIRFLRITLTLAARNPAVLPAVEASLPAIQNDIGFVLAEQTYATLNTPEGKDQLRSDLRDAINRVLEARGALPDLEQVLLTDLVMQ